ncbi:MAG TPA: amidohydrolase family protein [Acidimicrobiales bacterium]|nr:amidohydrolase family protein [Acidimicrobiales bacterium]
MTDQRKIDAFAHILTAPVVDKLAEVIPAFLTTPNITHRPAISDVDVRLTMMDRYPGYQQILTLTGPPLVDWLDEPGAAEMARRSNEALAELVAARPEHFCGFAADVSLPDVDFAVAEAERAVRDLGALGVQIYTNAKGRPLDEEEFLPFFDAVAALGVPVWIHPARTAAFADYASESTSKFSLWQKFGWPYDTTVCMARLIYSGLIRRHPDLVLLTHHAGGVVPHLAGRLVLHHEDEEMRRSVGIPEDFSAEETLDSYRHFYGDTVFSGAHHPLDCALEFFGSDHLLFATDMPYGAEGGELFVRETILAVEERPDVAGALFQDNAERILGVGGAAR